MNMTKAGAADYFEREATSKRLAEALLQNPGAPPARVCAVLHGPSGAGKTELARAFCLSDRAGERFPAGILWLEIPELSPAQSLREQLAQVHRAVVGVDASPGDASGTIAAILASKLTTGHLLVLDGGADREALGPFFSSGCPCALLVLRRQAPPQPMLVAKLIPVEVPDLEERVKILTHFSEGVISDDALIKEIAGAVIGMPRLLRIVGRELRRRVREKRENAAAAAAFILRAFQPGGTFPATPAPGADAEARCQEFVRLANSYLRGTVTDPDTLLGLAKQLATCNEFGLARKLLALARAHPDFTKAKNRRGEFITKHALFTYKDVDQPVVSRLESALKILQEGEILEETSDQETLGIAGAIHKRKWEADGQRRHLEQALGYYQRGVGVGLEKDHGYTGINAAYILDCLASQEKMSSELAGSLSAAADLRRDQAAAIRGEILRILPGLMEIEGNGYLAEKWWFFATLAEAAFGLQEHGEAAYWLAKASEIGAHPWEFESTSRQLAALARQQDGNDNPNSPGWKLIRRFTGNDAAAESTFIGKVGLALSGGGFRASLFHIGVLARLAELDLLRSVEVLSCVSGGSIIGAHYYLEVKALLEEKEDADITSDDYLKIVDRVAHEFLAGVQTNIRTRVAAEWWTNVRMTFDGDYSRSHRVGELYEKELFSRVGCRDQRSDAKKRGLKMSDLIIHPRGVAPGFKPRYANWLRRAKVPMLILNATTLNTGHNWQFTATFMGEPPGAIDTTIDGNDRLRRMYYQDAPEPYRSAGVRLGHAVAASAGVPGLFEPIALAGLFDDMTVRLVDGGVHDNQGVGGLLEQDATFLVVSDASGQMGVQAEPSQGMLGVPLRANDILMARVREAQAQELRTRRRAGLLRSLFFMHMKRDIDVDPRDWKGCPDPYIASAGARPASQRGTLTSYGIRKDMQKLIAALRTDLDAFCDAEAFALMTSGYRMTGREAEFEAVQQAGAPCRPDAPPWTLCGRIQAHVLWTTQEENRVPEKLWSFLGSIETHLNFESPQEVVATRLREVLEVGGQLAFKVWRLVVPLQIFAVVLGIAAVIGLVAAAWHWRFTTLLTVGGVALTLAGFVLTSVLGKQVMRVVNFRSELKRILTGLLMSLGGFLIARLHLWIFNPLFLRAGSMAHLSRPASRFNLRRFRSVLSCVLGAGLLCAWNASHDAIAARFGWRKDPPAPSAPTTPPPAPSKN